MDTYTSMVENVSVKSFAADEDGSKASKSIQLVDLPGHERLRVAGLLVSLKNEMLLKFKMCWMCVAEFDESLF